MDSPLNLAHQQQRKSECYSRSGKFEDAIACQVKAVELLDEALKLTRSQKGRESLELQKLYHIHQQDVIRTRQTRIEMRRREREAEEAKTLEEEQMEETIDPGGHDLRTAIWHVMNEQDSLLTFLRHRPLSPKVSQENVFAEGLKYPKTEQTAREELTIKNEELRRLLYIQFGVTERLQEENRHLRDENKNLKQLLEEHQRKISEHAIRRRPLNEINSPYALSPMADIGSGMNLRELPMLAPLEMPRFDFSSLRNENKTF